MTEQVQTIIRTCKQIHGEASSSTLVEDLASHYRRNQWETKLLLH